MIPWQTVTKWWCIKLCAVISGPLHINVRGQLGNLTYRSYRLINVIRVLLLHDTTAHTVQRCFRPDETASNWPRCFDVPLVLSNVGWQGLQEAETADVTVADGVWNWRIALTQYTRWYWCTELRACLPVWRLRSSGRKFIRADKLQTYQQYKIQKIPIWTTRIICRQKKLPENLPLEHRHHKPRLELSMTENLTKTKCQTACVRHAAECLQADRQYCEHYVKCHTVNDVAPWLGHSFKWMAANCYTDRAVERDCKNLWPKF